MDGNAKVLKPPGKGDGKPTDKKVADKVGGKKGGGFYEKHKYIVWGGLLLVLVILFFFLKRGGGSTQPTANDPNTTPNNIDPSTGLPYGAGTGSGPVMQGPPGSPGAAGARGRRGERGRRGKPGPVHHPKKHHSHMNQRHIHPSIQPGGPRLIGPPARLHNVH